ncbi:hypothetical protein CLV31_11416 [Algoriphagus aquaeductus]|uniref:Uncharacterized protein n=1 Tax=Algoriphagus aquaeductus TaxID=475299 RepID=A0A326RX18_9BACT|nr:hypothetical protein [Algoriphagus aquaeductus]PZV79584.1 hypothetical protein CLV31_11416 [Algoriphagus aquaeductus]
MLNIDKLYGKLTAVDHGEIFDRPNFNFKITSFTDDWDLVPLRNWGKSLDELQKTITRILDELEDSENYKFTLLPEFVYSNPNIVIYEYLDNVYPKKASFTFEDVILFGKQDELMFRRQNQSFTLKNDLKHLNAILRECQQVYETQKDSEIRNPTYLVHERIPFLGNEQQLSYFFKLLIDGGFILCSESDFETLNANFAANETENAPAKNKKAALKKHLIEKQNLAKKVADYFYCIAPQNSSAVGFEVLIPKSEGISSRMNQSAKIRIAKTDLERFHSGFIKIVKNLE